MDEKVDLNLADRETLAGLPGIGDVLAGRIIEYRETVRPFALEVELAHVPGISAKTVQEIGDLVTCSVPELPPPEPSLEPNGNENAPPVAGGDTARVDTAAAETAPSGPSAAPTVAVPEPPLVIHSPAPSRTAVAPLLLTAVLGALLGAALALGVIWLLNGSLQLDDSPQVEAVRQQAGQAAATARAEQARLSAELQQVSTRAAAAATREGRTAAALSTTESDLAAAQASLSEALEDVALLQTTAAGLDRRIAAAAASAENFDAFLGGMRDLLFDLQGTPTPQQAATRLTPQAAATVTATPAPTRAATATLPATRTPRPTATSIGGVSPRATP